MNVFGRRNQIVFMCKTIKKYDQAILSYIAYLMSYFVCMKSSNAAFGFANFLSRIDACLGFFPRKEYNGFESIHL